MVAADCELPQQVTVWDVLSGQQSPARKKYPRSVEPHGAPSITLFGASRMHQNMFKIIVGALPSHSRILATSPLQGDMRLRRDSRRNGEVREEEAAYDQRTNDGQTRCVLAFGVVLPLSRP